MHTVTSHGNTYTIEPRANLQDANLRGAHLQGADLQDADLRGAHLQDANLRDADLLYANLRGADLRGAHLQYADLQDADLQGADLRGADLQGAHLQGANLQDADLQGADLRGADLRGANLQYADLRGAHLQDARLQGANLQDANLQDADGIAPIVRARLSVLPDEGDVVGWKSCSGDIIVKLRIPAGAGRSNATGRKCRAQYAEVLEVIGAEYAVSIYDNSFIYRPGETVHPDSWDDDWTVECSHGVHFFITRAEAEAC